MSGDGNFIHCSRREHAGKIRMSPNSETYAHRREGKCACGETHNEPAEPRKPNGDHGAERARRIEATYPYCDEDGALTFQVVRRKGKSFVQRRPDGNGGWIWNMDGVQRVLYRLPELLAADSDKPIYIAEGEKDVDALRALGVEATCNPGGAGKWHYVADCARTALAGRHVVIIPDKDGKGRGHASQVAADTHGYVASIRRLELPGDGVKDAADWIAAGGTAAQLEELRVATPPGVDLGGVAVGNGHRHEDHAAALPGDADATPEVLHEDPGYAAGQAPAAELSPWDKELARALDDVTRLLGKTGKAARAPLFVEVGELFCREYPRTPWQVTGLITRGGTALLGAEPKSCKTWLATEIAVAVATGTKVCGEFFAERGTVAYFYAEDLDVQVRNRVRALAAARGIDPTTIRNLYVCPRGKFLDVRQNEDLAWIVASCRAIGRVDLVVLDPLRDIHSGEEDKSDSMHDVMRRIRLLGEILGCTVAISHHKGKQSKDNQGRRPGQTMRGSGAIHGSTDSGIYFGIRGGDAVAQFKLDVDVEIKGARSAGRFGLTLAIEDNAAGEAMRATWSVDRDPKLPKTAAKLAETDDKVFAFVRKLAMRGEVGSRRWLREHDEAPFGDKVMRASLDRLIDATLLHLDGSNVRIPQPTGGREDQ